jgi:hypothetical protein
VATVPDGTFGRIEGGVEVGLIRELGARVGSTADSEKAVSMTTPYPRSTWPSPRRGAR